MALEQRTLHKRIRALSGSLKPIPTDAVPRVTRLEGVRAVLFDVYGTLFVSGSGDVGTATAVDSCQAFRAALEAADLTGDLAAAASAGVDRLAHIVRAHQAAQQNRGAVKPEIDIRAVWREVLQDLADAGILAAAHATDHAARVAIEYECRVNPVWPMPEAEGTIARLKTAGFTLGIVSNAQFYTPLLFEALLDASVETLGFTPDFCAWSYELLEAKPSPRLFAGVLRALEAQRGIAPAETLYVGNDCLNDMWTAQQAGCRTALFAGDRRSLRWRESDPRCAGLKPDAVCTRLAQVAEVVGA